MKSMLENVPIHKNCINCGGCCRVIPATKTEINSIRKYLEDKPEIKAIANKNRHKSLDCPFRDDEAKKCLIYPVRPLICRLFGVAKGMKRPQGNSAEIDGMKFIQDKSVKLLNQIIW